MDYLKVSTDMSSSSWHPRYQIISQTWLIKQLKSSLALATSVLGEEIPLNQLKFLEQIQRNRIQLQQKVWRLMQQVHKLTSELQKQKGNLTFQIL